MEDRSPMYYKLAKGIDKKINQGIYKVGERIPSERELSIIFDVSRITVRQAINELVQEGKLNKVQGVGTFVSRKTIIQNLNSLYNFTNEMKKLGNEYFSKIVKMEEQKVSDNIANKLKINKNSKVVYLERIRYVENEPIMLEKTWFPYDGFNFLLEINIDKKGLYKTLDEDYGIVIDNALESIRATKLTDYEIKILESEENFGLLVKRIAYSNSKIVSYTALVSKANLVEFTIKLN